MKLTKEQRKLLVAWAAEGLNLREINERGAGCDPPFEITWYQLKHVRARNSKTYAALREDYERESITEGLARRAIRLREKMARHDLLKQVIEERAVEMAGEIAGAGTGLLVKDYKGKDADTPVYKVDAALLKEMRDLEREIAIEKGEWAEKTEISGPNGGAFVVNVIIDGPSTTSTPGNGVKKPGE